VLPKRTTSGSGASSSDAVCAQPGGELVEVDRVFAVLEEGGDEVAGGGVIVLEVDGGRGVGLEFGEGGFDLGVEGQPLGAEVGGEVLVEVFEAGVIDENAGDAQGAHAVEDGLFEDEVAAEEVLLRLLRMRDGHGQLHAGRRLFNRYDQHDFTPVM